MFSKLSESLKNKDKSDIIKRLIIILFIILIVLLALLLLSMYGPGINYISLERSDLVSVISNTINGYLSLIGSFMGVLASYWIFHQERLAEKKYKEDEKDENKKYALDMLSTLLSYTIIDYSQYWTSLGFYASNELDEVFTYTVDCKYIEVEERIKKHLNFIKDIPHEEIFEIGRYGKYGYTEKYTDEELDEIEKYFSILSSAYIHMKEVKQNNKQHSFSHWEIKNNIIYDKNWIDYLYYIDSEYREYVIKWINCLENNCTNDIAEVILWREKIIDLQISLGNKIYTKYKIINIIKNFVFKDETEDIRYLYS